MIEAIAIDGPAGAGKSTVAKAIARELGFIFLDTGAMYRAVALLAVRSRAWPGEDAAALQKIAHQMRLDFAAGNPQRVILNDEDVTDAIRTQEISDAASAISAFPGVRRELVARQKAMLAKGRVVLEGRDTTTVVCPDARLKIYLTASVEERAKRRWLELGERGSLEELKEKIAIRDTRDMTRADSPLKIAEGAVVLNTDALSADQVIAEVLSAWEKAIEL